jgi:bifunctional DNA-binding transcriptional regulator/antitoxin component of YhaV-PrlF toxin-antitoxin module
MAETLTIEVDEKGQIGTLPDPLQKFLDTRIKEAYRKGAEKVETELKHKLRSEADEERIKLLESENSRFKELEAKRKGDHEEAKKLAEERHAAELRDREDKLAAKDAELSRRHERLRAMLGAEIRAAATAAGARDESLPELQKLLGADLDLDATTLEGFVKDADGKPLEKDGKRVSIEFHVAQYLADHPHHLKTGRGKGGSAPGGQSLRGGTVVTDKDAAIAAAASNPSAVNVNNAIRSIRKQAS